LAFDSNAARRDPVFVLGPTASGKSHFAIQLAERIGGEIVGADSRQVYRGMDIGTGKVTDAERAAVPHHLIDVVDPDQPFGLADYLDEVERVLPAIRERGRVPIVVGGSGQYIWALAEGWSVPRVAPNPELRARLAERARTEGAIRLHSELTAIDPTAAGAIHPHNVRRVVRALELAATTGVAPSALRARRSEPGAAMLLGLSVPRAELRERIDRRVDWMFERGLVGEVQGLLARGHDPALPAMSGIGYTQVVQLLLGSSDLESTVERVKTATHRLARQQSTWFRSHDERILWLDQDPLETAMARLVSVSDCAAGVSVMESKQ
jgi:tRNA dimethylallyltransferase